MTSQDQTHTTPAGPEAGGRASLALRAMQHALPLGLVGLVLLFVALGAPNFLSGGNISDILRLSAPVMVVAVPMAFLLIMGHVDLSVGSVLAMSAVVTGLLITRFGFSPPVAILGGILACAVVGAVNGFFVTALNLSPIIVTLGSLTAVRGIALLIAPNSVYGFFPDAYVALSYGRVFGFPYYGIVAAIAVLVGFYLLSLSPVGRYARAIGVNEEAAFLSGINVRGTIFAGYVICAAFAGIAGTMYAMLLNSAPSGTLGLLFELDVLIAVMLGGVAFNGGRGTVLGVVLGVLFLAVLQNGLILLSVATAAGLAIKGGVLILAAALDRATLKATSTLKTM